ncbi:MAG: FAD-linked oxidase C-terminal domain-containing protein [Pirellulaceae bacterium]
MAARTALETQLLHWIRRGRVLTAPAQLAGYDADALGYKRYRPDAVVIPADCEELEAVVSGARKLDIPITIRGAGTSLSGGPVAAQGGVIVHTSALRKIRHVSREGFWCEIECGVALNQLDIALQTHGLFYPPDPSSGPVCTLGGNVAMNAGGAHCFRYGVTSNYVLGVEAVMLDGSLHRFGGPAGGNGEWHADWKRLMVGSEGTLAAFTRFWLRLLPRPEKAWTFRATFGNLRSAERAIHALSVHASYPVAIELMDPRCVAMVENSPMAVGLPQDIFLLVTEIEGPAELVDHRVQAVASLLTEAGSGDVQYSDDPTQRAKLWKARKVAGGLMGQISADFLVQDAVIPKSALADILQLVYDEADAAGLPTVNVFHAGDGNLHPNFLFDSRQPGELEKVEAISKRLMQRVVEVGGTLSGEHGIGNDKTAYMPLIFRGDTLRLQLAVPAIFNPRHQLNPLKVFASRRFGDHNGNGHNGNGHSGTPHRFPEAANASGLFRPFFDPIDGVMCVPAESTAEDIHNTCQPRGFRFPLILDRHRTLREQLSASQYAPGSSRFGPYCDNITGMNWRLPNGRIVRIGERVVKSTTGYDLLRFLLHLPTNTVSFGEPVDFVLRLRPDSGRQRIAVLAGQDDAVSQAAHALLPTSWMNWFDAVDVIARNPASSNKNGCSFSNSLSTRLALRVSVNSPEEDWPRFECWLNALSDQFGLTMIVETHDRLPVDGCPDFVLKTTPDRVVALAREVAEQYAADCVALCYCGVVHGYLMDSSDAARQVDEVVSHVAPRIHEVGGDWRSRHVAPPETRPPESVWLGTLAQEFARP